MKCASSLVALCLVLYSRTAFAEDSVPRVEDIPPGEDRIVSVTAGSPAPFTGQLFDPETSLRWANWLAQYKLRLQHLESFSAERLTIERAFQAKQETILANAAHREASWYQSQLQAQSAETLRLKQEMSDPPFYRTVWCGFVAGVLTVSLAIGVGAAVVGAGS